MAYNPNQPRDPAGTSTGGQWSGGSGTRVNPILREKGVVNAKGQLSPQTRALWEKKLQQLESKSMLTPKDFSHMVRLRGILGRGD